MGTWNSRGLRGSFLEELINMTIETYHAHKLAMIQKVPTPITPMKIDKESGQITLAFFDKKSTVDYIGVVQGVPVCFDAKECQTDNFPLANIHEHQYEFMRDYEAQDGVAFLIIYFKGRDVFYYLRFKTLRYFWERMESGGAKHFKYDELDPAYQISGFSGTTIHFLETLQRDINER